MGEEEWQVWIYQHGLLQRLALDLLCGFSPCAQNMSWLFNWESGSRNITFPKKNECVENCGSWSLFAFPFCSEQENNTLPSPVNLHRWGMREDLLCMLSGSKGIMEHRETQREPPVGSGIRERKLSGNLEERAVTWPITADPSTGGCCG